MAIPGFAVAYIVFFTSIAKLAFWGILNKNVFLVVSISSVIVAKSDTVMSSVYNMVKQ